MIQVTTHRPVSGSELVFRTSPTISFETERKRKRVQFEAAAGISGDVGAASPAIRTPEHDSAVTARANMAWNDTTSPFPPSAERVRNPRFSGHIANKRQNDDRQAKPEVPLDATELARISAKLRGLVRSSIMRHHMSSALFYADKLLTMSNGDANDVLMFADACYLNREYHRAIHAIKQSTLLHFSEVNDLTDLNLRALLLLGQCMLAIKQKEECLEMLTRVLPEEAGAIVRLAQRQGASDNLEEHETSVNIVASLALLMGETYEAVGNRENAAYYFRTALQCDVKCCQAFIHLVDKQMMSSVEEKNFIASLAFASPETQLVGRLYESHISKYDVEPPIEEKFARIEVPFHLEGNLELSIAKGDSYYYQHDIQKAHEICEWVRERDPYNFRMISLYVATMVELGTKRELYHYAHQMVDVYPKKAAAWYTVGCYYLLVQKFEAAQRYFHKATTLEPGYAPAWIGFGNSFAAQDESDQAMSSYRTASSLFPGCHLPPLFIGMEHLRTNNLIQALEFIKQASMICPSDPLVYNELGAVYYKQKNYPKAIEMFTKALDLCKHLPERLLETWEPTMFNLGYAYRKVRKYDKAIQYFQSALRLNPRNASIHAALGFTFHMKGSLAEAIESYHTALAYNPEETLAGEMITVAFDESLGSSHLSFEMFGEQYPTSSVGRVNALAATSTKQQDKVKRTLNLDQSFSSIEPSQHSVMYSSIDFSEDSSMNVDD
ncbi:TPA: hypothetical protein N0F65_006923 [Lagenidium giganteum]|uniref:Uncharacterized protein n=1 Tax=Lagenidium giganteum TaxID=4803 RepID=A0AAV2ZFW1_9STRA|nr:TPA: hypothetical protein N0F65_006923 [Lagenidium giganteum]